MTKQEEQSRKLLEKTSDEILKVFEEGFNEFLSTGAEVYEITPDGKLRNLTYGDIMRLCDEAKIQEITDAEFDNMRKQVEQYFQSLWGKSQ